MIFSLPIRTKTAVENLTRYVRDYPGDWVHVEDIRLLLKEYKRLKAFEDAITAQTLKSISMADKPRTLRGHV